jgi:nucleoside 2-deoxyribosyltransferase
MNLLARTHQNDAAIHSTIDSLEKIFTIILALAIGEALKQLVPDDKEFPTEHRVDYRRLPALLSFLLLIVPFYHGMLLYFTNIYDHPPRPAHYGFWLIVDCLAFTIEACLFFILSRSLPPRQWMRFYGAVLWLLVVDVVWAITIHFHRLAFLWRWIWLDLGALVIFGAVALFFREPKGEGRDQRGVRRAVVWILLALCFVRTAVDYWWNWEIYFPPDEQAVSYERIDATGLSASTRGMHQTFSPHRAKIYFAGPLFTQAEWRWNAEVAAILRRDKLDVILPQEASAPMLADSVPYDSARLFRENLANIEKADAVVAILDGPDADSGTCFECGFARHLGRPVIGIRTDIRRGGDDPDAGVNLMLSHGCSKMVSLPLGRRDDTEWVAREISGALSSVLPHPTTRSGVGSSEMGQKPVTRSSS